MKLLAKVALLPALLLAFTLSSCSKGDKPKDTETAPEKVQTAFKDKFAQGTDVKWSKESETEWEADFKMSGKDYSANFSSEGEWKETEYEIAVTEIPANIKTAMDSAFVGYTIKKAELSEKATGKLYEVEMEKGEKSLEAVYDVNAKLVKQVNEDSDKKGDQEENEEDEKNEKKEGDEKNEK